MEEEELTASTINDQFYEFARLLDDSRSGTTINLYCSDFWMRQAKLIDDRKVTMTDTGILFNKYSKTELNIDEWLEFLADLCDAKGLDVEIVKETLVNCGIPNLTLAIVPAYRKYFKTYKSKNKMVLGITYCNATFDSFLCWPPTPAGGTTSQSCPAARLSDTTRQAFRRCGNDGVWLGRHGRSYESDHKGWTNYTPCFPTEVQKLLEKVNVDEDAQYKLEIAQRTRYLEMVGFSISLIALLLSLFIFTHFRSLRNSRTNIHRNLFSAMTVQVIIRLIVYIDQAIIRDKTDTDVTGIESMPYICELSYILLEYAVTAMFMWMFIEGLFLHNMVTANVLREKTSPALFMAIGWGLPALMTGLWATVTAFHYMKDDVKGCWYGYNFLTEYWLLQAPRLAVIMINLLFLLNIMRVLITKLNATENNDITKVKKAARAALVLLPLLGITNLLNMIEPVDKAVWMFALWCYVTHFLRSFQGFFIALLYCFINGEVNEVVSKTYRDRLAERQDLRRSRKAAAIARNNTTNSRWWQTCLLVCIINPIRNLSVWVRRLCSTNNAVHNAEVALETSEEIRRRNYADPDFQCCMEEIRLENNTLVTGSV